MYFVRYKKEFTIQIVSRLLNVTQYFFVQENCKKRKHQIFRIKINEKLNYYFNFQHN